MPAADVWIIEARKAQTSEEVAAALKEFSGYYVLRLVKCDGVPTYSNGGLYEGVDGVRVSRRIPEGLYQRD